MDTRTDQLRMADTIKRALRYRIQRTADFKYLADALLTQNESWHAHYESVVSSIKGRTSNIAIRKWIENEQNQALLDAWDARQRGLSSGACAELVNAATSKDFAKIQPLMAPAIQSYLQLTTAWNKALDTFMYDIGAELAQLEAIAEPLAEFAKIIEPYHRRTRQYWRWSFNFRTDNRTNFTRYNEDATRFMKLEKGLLSSSEPDYKQMAQAVRLQMVSDTLTWTLTSKTTLGIITFDTFDDAMQTAYIAAVHAAVLEEKFNSAVQLRELPFAPDDKVRIFGLRNATDLNHTKGTVESKTDNGRYQVRCEHDSKTRLIRAINLVSAEVDLSDCGTITLDDIAETASGIVMNTVIYVSDALRLPAARMARVENADIVREFTKRIPTFKGTITMAPYQSTRDFISGTEKNLAPALLNDDPLTLQDVQANTTALQDNLKNAIIFHMATVILENSENARTDMVEALATLGLKPGASIPEVIKAYDILRVPYQAKMDSGSGDDRELIIAVDSAYGVRKGSGDLAKVVESVAEKDFERFKRQLEYKTIHMSLQMILSPSMREHVLPSWTSKVWQYQQAAMVSLGYTDEYDIQNYVGSVEPRNRYRKLIKQRARDRTNDSLDHAWIIDILMKSIKFEGVGIHQFQPFKELAAVKRGTGHPLAF